MLPYIAEFLGTMILIILGDGVVANVTLNKSGMKGAGSIQITFAWGLAVMLPAFIFGAASGAHFNPALTIALAVDGSLAWVLVFAIKGIGQVTGIAPGVDKLLVFGIIVSIGMSLGGLTGYAINPARDLGPRLAHAVLPIKGKGDSNWGYAPVVIIGPVVGAVVAALLYQAIPWM